MRFAAHSGSPPPLKDAVVKHRETPTRANEQAIAILLGIVEECDPQRQSVRSWHLVCILGGPITRKLLPDNERKS